MMQIICLFYHNMLALATIMIQLIQQCICILQQTGLKGIITPGAGHQSSTNLGANFILVGINDQLQGAGSTRPFSVSRVSKA